MAKKATATKTTPTVRKTVKKEEIEKEEEQDTKLSQSTYIKF